MGSSGASFVEVESPGLARRNRIPDGYPMGAPDPVLRRGRAGVSCIPREGRTTLAEAVDYRRECSAHDSPISVGPKSSGTSGLGHLDSQPGGRHDLVCQLESVAPTPLAPTIPITSCVGNNPAFISAWPISQAFSFG